MKTLHLRALVGLLLLTLFSQTLLAATRMVHCAFSDNIVVDAAVTVEGVKGAEPPPGPQHCHEEGFAESVAGLAAAPHSALHLAIDGHAAQTTDSSSASLQHSLHCQPDCSCCWNACSASLLVDTCSALTLIPATETYHATSALLPASPVEQSLRPPRFA